MRGRNDRELLNAFLIFLFVILFMAIIVAKASDLKYIYCDRETLECVELTNEELLEVNETNVYVLMPRIDSGSGNLWQEKNIHTKKLQESLLK